MSVQPDAKHLVRRVALLVHIIEEARDIVVGFRNALVDRRHNFAFKTCQGLWDLDSDNLSDEAVRSLCKELGIPSSYRRRRF